MAVFQSLPPGHGVTMPGGNDKWKVPFWDPVGFRKCWLYKIYHVTIILVLYFFNLYYLRNEDLSKYCKTFFVYHK